MDTLEYWSILDMIKSIQGRRKGKVCNAMSLELQKSGCFISIDA